MATKRSHSRPGLTLAILAGVTAVLYTIMGFNNAWTPRLGLDLRGGTTITLTASDASGSGTVTAEKLSEARGIIQQRVDGLGVGEAVVTTLGDTHIQIAAPNVQRDELLELVGTTAKLNFRPVFGVMPVVQPLPDATPSPTPSEGATTAPTTEPSPATTPGGTPTLSPTPEPSPAASVVPTTTAGPQTTPAPTAVSQPSASPAPTSSLLSPEEALAWQPSPEELTEFQSYKCKDPHTDELNRGLMTCDREGTQKYLLGPVLIEGTSITGSTISIPQNEVNYAVSLNFDTAGADVFLKATGQLAIKQAPQNAFAIVLDSKVISAPVPRGPIAGGKAEISGNFTRDSAAQLSNVLKYGALPLAFDVSQVESVSATLGGEQLAGGLIAGAIGLGLVILYCFIYYRALGLLVVGSLGAAATIAYATMVLLGEGVGFALNLPGIAGVIVAIGLTADSFIIYFERIRDEIREGKSLRTAIETGWRRARGTIVISDMVSMLSATVLFILAVGGVKGFAFTLGLTTLIDLVIVFWFTKPAMSLLGRTKFFGEGHSWSGFDPDHMGVSQASLLGRRGRVTAAAAKEA